MILLSSCCEIWLNWTDPYSLSSVLLHGSNVPICETYQGNAFFISYLDLYVAYVQDKSERFFEMICNEHSFTWICAFLNETIGYFLFFFVNCSFNDVPFTCFSSKDFWSMIFVDIFWRFVATTRCFLSLLLFQAPHRAACMTRGHCWRTWKRRLVVIWLLHRKLRF